MGLPQAIKIKIIILHPVIGISNEEDYPAE